MSKKEKNPHTKQILSDNKVIQHHLLFDSNFLNSCNSTFTIVISS